MTTAPQGMFRRFIDKACLVSGGGSGIGRATCERLAAEGARVAVLDHQPEQGLETVERICQSDGEAFYLHADVSDTVQVQAAVRATVERWGRIDVLVNNAAIMRFGRVVDMAEEDWDRVMSVNLRGVFLLCKYSLPHMARGGAVVNVSSVHAHETSMNVSPYAASKGGLEAFSRALSLECVAQGVRVNNVAPGSVDTPMLWSNPNVRNGTEKIDGAVARPDEIAAAICFMASEEASFITGTTLVADSGKLTTL